MAKKIVVEQDAVTGTDTHAVAGSNTLAPPTPYSGTGSYDYKGAMTDALSDFLTVDGTPVALTSSRSSLDPGETAPPTGGHSGPAGRNFQPPSPPPAPPTLNITGPVGEGRPGAAAGSRVLSAGGVAVLLDGDAIDTCDTLQTPGNSKVAASHQDFVSCSE